MASCTLRSKVRLGVEEQILGKLLGEGRTALHHMPGHHVGKAGPRHADGIKPEMIAEAAVLDGDKGVGHIGGQVCDLDHLRPASARAARSCGRDHPEW